MDKKSKAKDKISVLVKIDKGMKEKAEQLMEEMGLDFNTAVNVFVYQVYYTRSIPFPIKLPENYSKGEY